MSTGASRDDQAAGECELVLALLAGPAAGGARRAARSLLHWGRPQIQDLIAHLPAPARVDAEETASRLWERGVRALLCDDRRYPDSLRRFSGAPPALFCLGPMELLERPAVGVCGSRDASDEGIRAARACGEEAAHLGVAVVSGYAKGVDTAGHLAALEAGGTTIAVLAEGIDHFRAKTPYRELGPAAGVNMLVVSQFPPAQRWTAGAAMTRKQVIVGLSRALVVVEARDTGGTLKAGEIALRGSRPVFVLNSTSSASPGNQRLISAGGRHVADRRELRALLQTLRVEQTPLLAID
ncbi:DNA-processing protein DprA [Amycolatopsis thermoflava]|uniref:DNA-processing protein DprA n=1 Tax=Amycolatopsis thermoflava TaxID=84480 RepID=UPI0037F14B3C